MRSSFHGREMARHLLTLSAQSQSQSDSIESFVLPLLIWKWKICPFFLLSLSRSLLLFLWCKMCDKSCLQSCSGSHRTPCLELLWTDSLLSDIWNPQTCSFEEDRATKVETKQPILDRRGVCEFCVFLTFPLQLGKGSHKKCLGLYTKKEEEEEETAGIQVMRA